MKNFSLAKHDPDLLAIIQPVKQNSKEHKILATWAIDCLNRVLPLFEKKYPDENVPRIAVDTLKKWQMDEIKMWDARKYCFTVLKCAKKIEESDTTYSQIVRAAHHCLATCHVPTHSEGTAMYVVSFIKRFNSDESNVIELMELEREWQLEHLRKLMKEVAP